MSGPARMFEVARNPDAASRLPYLVRPAPARGRRGPQGAGAVAAHRRRLLPPGRRRVAPSRRRRPSWSSGSRSAPAGAAAAPSTWSWTGPREHRSQLVFTRVRGRPVIFWQSPRTARAARPGVRGAGPPGGRPRGAHHPGRHPRALPVAVRPPAGGDAERRALPAGDYAVEGPTGSCWRWWSARPWPTCRGRWSTGA
jgi:hypothetical protein